ncbi:hypothetical protein GCM10022239_06260 [Leifsonia bigeumensis]|uniref:Transposase n=1 Tax=Leifsonella bigeumensis TaxID=433643 RepID=A0ABP7F9T0_9MICO
MRHRFGYDLAEVVAWVASLPGLQKTVYEAGPTGFGLARLLRLDEITAVRVPSIEEETARDLVRSREDTRQDLMAARHRLSKLMLRHGLRVFGRGSVDSKT